MAIGGQAAKIKLAGVVEVVGAISIQPGSPMGASAASGIPHRASCAAVTGAGCRTSRIAEAAARDLQHVALADALLGLPAIGRGIRGGAISGTQPGRGRTRATEGRSQRTQPAPTSHKGRSRAAIIAVQVRTIMQGGAMASDQRAGHARPLLGDGFAEVPDAELDVLAAAMSEVEVDAGTKIVTVDRYGGGIYLIEQGEAEVVAGNAMPSAEVLGPGEVFGEIALLLTGERTATVVARTPMRLRALADVEFNHIRERVPQFERALRRVATERVA
jgi:hypothetical protein